MILQTYFNYLECIIVLTLNSQEVSVSLSLYLVILPEHLLQLEVSFMGASSLIGYNDLKLRYLYPFLLCLFPDNIHLSGHISHVLLHHAFVCFKLCDVSAQIFSVGVKRVG
jgi:hypothetical protein